MRIEGRQQGSRGEGLRPLRVTVMVDELSSGEYVVAMQVDGGVTVYFDGNHAEALETAIRAARLELEARSKASR